MADSLLVDTGPLVALYALNDRAHRTVAVYLRESRCSLLTTWPVLAEAWHLLPAEGRLRLMHWLRRGGVQALEFDDGASGELIGMLEKYRDLPMDLADASLVLLAHKTGISDILTLDRRDFLTYRLPGNKRFHWVLDA